MKKELREWPIAIIVSILLLFLVNTFLFKPYTVSGLSMYPMFNNKDKVVVSKISKSLNHLKSGELLYFIKTEIQVL